MPTETETDQKNEVIDFGWNVSEADVARPVLQGGTYPFKITRTYEELSRKAQIPTLVVVYSLDAPAKDTKGNTVNPGFTMYQRVLKQPTGGLTQQMIKDRVNQIHFAAAGEGAVNTAAWIGKTVLCRVSLREAHTDKEGISRDDSNEIVRVMPMK